MQPTICIPKSIACRSKLCLLGISGLLASQPVWSQCSATPQAALASYGGEPPSKTADADAGGRAFEVWRTMKDPTLGRQWFWIKACGASPRPAQLLWAPLSLEKRAYATATKSLALRAIKKDHLLGPSRGRCGGDADHRLLSRCGLPGMLCRRVSWEAIFESRFTHGIAPRYWRARSQVRTRFAWGAELRSFLQK